MSSHVFKVFNVYVISPFLYNMRSTYSYRFKSTSHCVPCICCM